MFYIFVLCSLLRLRQAEQAKMASKKVDMWGHVLTALAAAGFGSGSSVEVAMCVYACVCTVCACLCILVGHGGSDREHRQRIMGLMPGEIMTLPNRILGNQGDSSCGKNDVIKLFWLLSRTTGFMEGGSFNLRRRRKGRNER